MTVRAVVGRPVANDFPGLVDTRKILVADADGRVGLVIFQQDVVTWFVFLDKVVLQQQGILLRIDHNVADICNLRHQHPCLGRLVVFGEIRVHTPLQVLGLSHIDDDSLLVQVLVYARSFRKVQYDSFQVFAGIFFLFYLFHGCLFQVEKQPSLQGLFAPCKEGCLNSFYQTETAYSFSKVVTSTFSSKAFRPFSPSNSMTKLTYACFTPQRFTSR